MYVSIEVDQDALAKMSVEERAAHDKAMADRMAYIAEGLNRPNKITIIQLPPRPPRKRKRKTDDIAQ